MSKLNEEQQALFDKIIKDKKNIFFTGCAGTGKSFLLKELIKYLKLQATLKDWIAVTASTGRAAFNIGGTTLHSFAAIGLGNQTEQKLVENITFNKKAATRWKNTKVLIIDEISMITGELLDKLEFIAKRIRKNSEPFGGIQLIFTGDLLQLPPVMNNSQQTRRVFESNAWKNCIHECIALRTVMRQSDWEFVKVLTCIRLGAVTEEVYKFVEQVSKEKTYDSESGPVHLYATKAKTDNFNTQQLNQMEGEEIIYTANDEYIDKNKSTKNMFDNCPAPSELIIKIGAQVMLIKNLNEQLVNGTVGIISGFTEIDKNKKHNIQSERIPLVRFTLNDGRVFTKLLKREEWSIELPGGQIQASRSQIPLILAWAVTIHKSQGQTIQKVKADLTGVFEYGQIYTALSRAVSIDTLEVVGFDPNKIKVDQKSVEFYVNNDLI